MSKTRNSARNTYIKRDLYSEKDIDTWAEGVITAWVRKIQSLGVSGSGTLVNSFRHHVIWEARGSGGTEQYLNRVIFLFESYGKYLDYGLGRGTDIQDRFAGGRNASSNPRRRKQWIAEPWMAELKALKPIIREQAARYTKALLVEGFESGAEVQFKARK